MMLWDEFLAAVRGSWALLRGDRRAPACFDFTRGGLYGSFIGLLIAVTLNGLLPALLGLKSAPLAMALITVAITYGAQMAFSAMALRQMHRLDGFLPYVVAENWTTVVLVLVAAAGMLAGAPAEMVLIVIGIAGIVIKVNIARLIVTLSPWQIAILIVAQLAGGAVGLLVVGMTLPLPPEAVEAAAAASAG